MFPRSLPALATCVLSVFCAGPGTGLFTFLFQQPAVPRAGLRRPSVLGAAVSALRHSRPSASVVGSFCSSFSELLGRRAEIVPLS